MHSIPCAHLIRHLTITILAILFISGCGEGDGQESIAGTPTPPLPGVLVDSPVSGVSWATSGSGFSGITDAGGTFQYLSFDNVTFSIGGIVLGTVQGAPVITAVELTNSSSPTDQAALNMLVFLQSIDSDSDPSNGITVSAAAQTNASGIALDFNNADFATQIAAVVEIIVPGNIVVSETDALNHFYNTYAAFGGTDTFSWSFPGYPPVGGGASFELVFADEFNEGTAPDPAKWTYETGYGSNGWGNNEWQLYTESPDNVRVEDGNLVISALCPAAPCGIRDGSITSGKINTLGKFNFKFGKIVARIKPPTGKAAWPAFWSLGTNFPEIGWPRSGEIDFMEVHNFFSDENTTHFTMHWFDENADSWMFDSQFLTTGENLGDDFHIFEADWNEDRIIGKIDGQTYFTRDIEPDTMEEFLEEFYLILNVAMGGTLGSGNEPPAGDETFPQTMLVDYVRVFQGSEGSGGGGAGGVLANFDDITPPINEFGGAAPAIEAGPAGGDGNALKITRPGGEVFAGVFLEVSGIPTAGGEQTISALVYSPTAGIPFVTKLEYEENVGTGDVQANEAVVVGWQTLTWTYNLEAGNDYNRFVILPDLGTVGAGEEYYIDNITLVGDDGGDGGGDGGTGGGDAPTVAAPTPPARDAADVVSLFSDAYTDVTVDTWRTDWSIASLADVDIAGNATKEYTNLNFVGIETVAEQVDATGMTHLHVDVWTPNAETLEIKLVDFGPNGAFEGNLVLDDTEGSIFYDGNPRPVPAQGEWLSLDIPLADFEAAGLVNRANIAQLIFAADPRGDAILYVDNVYFYNGAGGGGGTGGGDTPAVAAPTPTVPAANVVSLFSDAYTDVTVDTWRTDWSVADLTEITLEGQDVKQYTNLDFVGIETVANPIDASGMTHFHVDVWTPDATQLRIKLVDFGADGAFAGGDDTEGELIFDDTTTPALAQGQWISLDIPLTDFEAVGLTTRANIAQYIFAASPPGTVTLFVTNMYFYNDAAGGTAPTVAAPAPTQDASNVISLFSDAYTDVSVDTWRTDWSDATFADVMVAGNATKEYTALNFVGIETVANQVDASGMTHFRADVWTPDITELRVKLVDFGADGAFGGGDDTEHELIFDGASTPALVQGQWISLDIPLTDFTGLTNTSNIAQYIFAATPVGTSTLYVDNVYFYNDAGGASAPTVAAPTPSQDAASVISLFSDAYMDAPVDTWRTDWSDATFADVTVDGNATKEYTALNFVGIETVVNQIDASGMTHFRVDFWTPDITELRVKLVDFGADAAFGGGDDTEHELIFDTTAQQGQWISLDIPLTDFTGLINTSNIAQYIFAATPVGTSTLYIDNMYFYNSVGGGSAPTVAAPTPSQSAADVISLFSDAYMDVAVDTWRTDWSDATFADVMVAGNATKEYTALNFVGIETVASQVDASGMTHFRVDFWTPDITELRVKLVDFGADAAFGGGDDTEHELIFDTTAQQGQWISLDIPLADFTGLTNTSNIAQYILAATPVGTSTLYIDNMYFYNAGGGGSSSFVNGNFETGDFTGWVQTLIPDAVGSIAIDNSGQGGRTGSVARLITDANVTRTNDVLISQVALEAGTISAGDSINVSFDLYGTLFGAGGVVFVEVIFLDASGQDVGGRDFVGPAAPYVPTTTWTNHSGTVIAGTATGGGQFDVSGGVTLQLKVACGAIDGCGVDASFDNVTFTIN